MQRGTLWINMLLCFIIGSAITGLQAGKQPGSRTGLVITFRDCHGGLTPAGFSVLHPDHSCPVEEDRVRSDWGQSYVDGENGVEAFLGSQATSGNFLLNLVRSPRAMVLDFAECVSPSRCTAPASQSYSLSSIRIDATAVKTNGVLGMAVNETISAPARVTYRISAEQTPGFIDFNPNLSGKTPCKGASDFVSVTRTGDTTWEVIADPSRIGCVTLPDNAGWAGNYRFPFRFTVQVK